MIDYTEMDGPGLLKELGDNGKKWGEAFCQHAKKHGHDINEDWMTTWFSNAIENSWQVRVRREEAAA